VRILSDVLHSIRARVERAISRGVTVEDAESRKASADHEKENEQRDTENGQGERHVVFRFLRVWC